VHVKELPLKGFEDIFRTVEVNLTYKYRIFR
jgi:hypothetical protein